MKGNVGLWIDHREAIVVGIDKSGRESIHHIKSNVERRTRLAGGSRTNTLYGPQGVVSEQKRDQRHLRHLDVYYESVVDVLKDATSFRIFGPGEAKRELKKKIESNKSLAGRLSGIESVDKMTERQIVAKVKEYYRPGRSG